MLLHLPLWGWPDALVRRASPPATAARCATTRRRTAIAELRLVAATLMRLRAGRHDPAAMPEAQRRLAYWRGDPDAPTWRAQ